MTTQFTPPQNAVITALELLSLMALHQQAQEHELNIRTQILDANNYPCDPLRLEEYRKRGIEVSEFIKNATEDYLIDGLQDIDNPNTPWAKYFSEWDRRMKNLGYIHGANTTCKVDNQMREVKEKLFYITQKFPSIPQIEFHQLTGSLKYYREYFELTLQMLAPYCNDYVEKEAIGKKIFSQYHNQ